MAPDRPGGRPGSTKSGPTGLGFLGPTLLILSILGSERLPKTQTPGRHFQPCGPRTLRPVCVCLVLRIVLQPDNRSLGASGVDALPYEKSSGGLQRPAHTSLMTCVPYVSPMRDVCRACHQRVSVVSFSGCRWVSRGTGCRRRRRRSSSVRRRALPPRRCLPLPACPHSGSRRCSSPWWCRPGPRLDALYNGQPLK